MPAIDFPAAPAVNQEYTFEGRTWLWNGTGWEVKAFVAPLGATGATGPGSFAASSSPPASPSEGDEWLDEDTGTLYTYLVDVDGGQWVEFGPEVAGFIGATGPVGPTGVGISGPTGPTGPTGAVALSRVVVASGTSGTLTPNSDTTDIYIAEGLTGAITLTAPSGTPVNGQKLLLRIKDNGTARGITWTTSSGAFRAIGITLPTTTVLSKVTYVGCIYNSADLFWDAIATVTQA